MQKHPGSILEGFTKTQISTFAVKDNFLVAGGYRGELICKVSLAPFTWIANLRFISFAFGYDILISVLTSSYMFNFELSC